MDTIVGTSANDIVNASNTATSAVLGGLDSIDGGAGSGDVLNVTDTAIAAAAAFNLPTGFTVKNVETVNVVANGALGDKAGAVVFDVSGMTGLTTFNGTSAGDGTKNHNVKAAGTADVALTVSAGTTDVNGGKSVSITGGSTATVTDAAGATGTTLTSVTLNKVGTAGGITSVLTGNGIATVTLSGSQAVGGAANTVTVTNATVGHALTINAAGTGYDATATPIKVSTVVTDTAATSLTINTSAKSAVNASGSTAVKSVTLTGAGALDLTAMGATTTSIDGSAATGALTLNSLDAAVVTLKTGAGADKATLNATAKATVDTGAGNDILTLGAILAAGSTVGLGAGDDTLLGAAVPAASTVSAVTTIDGGDGVDSVASTLINAGNAAQFKNFERVSIGNATVDASLLTASTITGVSIDGNTGTGVLTGLTQSQSLYVNADNGGTSSTLTFTGVAGTSDAYAIAFNAKTTGTTAAPATVDAKVVSIEGIESVTVASGSAGGVNANAISLKDANAKSLTITGDQALTVTFNTAFGTAGATTGVATIDASAATGGVNVNLTNVVAAANGITVTGGAGKDTFTAIATVLQTFVGGAGADTFNLGAALGTTPLATISDLAVGDKIDVAGANITVAALGAKKDVSAAISLATALDIANGATTTAGAAGDAKAVWFQYGGNTYLYSDVNVAGDFGIVDTADNIVKITGVIDLSTSTITATGLLTVVAA